ncbi:MAG: TonB-dependent receptor [Sphingomonadales bacterium]|nr:TonB-dependent receptor [Sphingomonadales bacterium]
MQNSGVIGALKGDRLPGVPKYQSSAAIQYNFDGIGGAESSIRFEHQYIGSSLTDFTPAGALEIGGFNVVNARTTMSYEGYDITLFANNLFDSKGITNAIHGMVLPITDAAFRIRPRTLGITLRADF